MATVLITGARGMLGRRFHEAFGARHRVAATTWPPEPGFPTLDITDEAAVAAAVGAARPEWIVNAAAYTAVDKAESEELLATRINAEGPAVLARAAAAAGARFLHVSTDFVFDGDKAGEYLETDPPRPLSAYARSKEAGEREVRRWCPDHVILRVAWLFGPEGKNFVDTILGLARTRDRLRVVADQRGTPTFTRDAATAAVSILEAGLGGTIHAVNRGITTWCDFAREAVRLAGLRTPVDAIRTEDYPTPAVRPRNSALRNGVLEATIGDRMRPWTAALAEYLRRS